MNTSTENYVWVLGGNGSSFGGMDVNEDDAFCNDISVASYHLITWPASDLASC